LASYCTLVALLASACSDSNSLLVTTEATDGREDGVQSLTEAVMHADPASGVWPPQPDSLENAESYPSSVRAGVMSGILRAARRSVLNNPQVKDELGSDYREIDATFGDNKGTDVANIVFYNYATDETVDVAFGKDGSVLSQVYAAEVYQPAEHPQETEDAINLARTALTESSFDVTNLQATAMLAFPPITDMLTEQKQFYPQRTLYVTFGTGEGAMPIYSALVDLSSASVVEHGLVR